MRFGNDSTQFVSMFRGGMRMADVLKIRIEDEANGTVYEEWILEAKV